MVMTVNVIGAGRVGQTFLRLLAGCSGYDLQDVASSRLASAELAVAAAGSGRAVRQIADMRPADILFLTVPDTQIGAVAEELANSIVTPAIAVHCSGFHTADVMSALGPEWQLVSAHPNLSFADPDSAVAAFKGTPCGVEGDDEAALVIEALLEDLGAQPFRIASENKVLYHAAAVFSNNFATVLQAVAREAWDAAGVPKGVAKELNASLLKATAENVIRQGPQDALTGPAARGDTDVVARQGQAVAEWNEHAGRVYRDLSEMAEQLKSKGSTR